MRINKKPHNSRPVIGRTVVQNMELLDCMSPEEVQERIQEQGRINGILRKVRLSL